MAVGTGVTGMVATVVGCKSVRLGVVSNRVLYPNWGYWLEGGSGLEHDKLYNPGAEPVSIGICARRAAT